MRHWLLSLTLLAGVCVGLKAADVPTSNLQSVASRVASAREAIRAMDWSRALVELLAAAREEPRNADVHNLLG